MKMMKMRVDKIRLARRELLRTVGLAVSEARASVAYAETALARAKAALDAVLVVDAALGALFDATPEANANPWDRVDEDE